jgi:hypothetical protein
MEINIIFNNWIIFIKIETYNNIQLFDELNKLKKFKNFKYYLFINAGHLIYLDDIVIDKIFEII